MNRCKNCGHRLLHHAGEKDNSCLAYDSYNADSPDAYHYEKPVNITRVCGCTNPERK